MKGRHSLANLEALAAHVLALLSILPLPPLSASQQAPIHREAGAQGDARPEQQCQLKARGVSSCSCS